MVPWLAVVSTHHFEKQTLLTSSIVVVAGLANDATSCAVASSSPQWAYLLDWYVEFFLLSMSLIKIYRGLPMVFGLVLLVLALIKAAGYWRLRKFEGSRLLKVLITDQIVYFAA
jgi:hypothetical protein